MDLKMEKPSVLVLIAEEHPDILDILQDAFEHGGFVFLPVKSAEMAISAIDDPRLEIMALVTDIRLGSSLSGWDVARRAREKTPALPIVYTTGSESSDWPSLGVPNSILVTKPSAPSQVLTAVSQLLNAAGSLPC